MTPRIEFSDHTGTRPLESVSCPTSTFCAAVDNHGQLVTYSSGSGWGTPISIDGTKVLNSVSCPTTTSTNCVAVDANGDAVYYNGSTWTDPNISSHALNAVSCVTATSCDAVDNAGNVFTFSGSWSSADDIDGTHPLESISCPNSSFCLASDNNGGVLYFTGSSWTGAQDIDASRNISAVSCISATTCQAMDTAGHVLVGGDAGWSSALLVDAAHTPDALSCATQSFCVMSDGGGRVLDYIEAQLTWDTNGSLPTVVSDGSDDYIYGPNNEPIEEIGTTATTLSSVPNFMTYTPGNSSWLLTNAAGNESGFYDFDAFGTLSGTQGSAFGYAGQYQGSGANTSGFDNMRARWYDAQTGSFTTRDPAFSETDQAYAYAGDDPVNEIDPTGDLGCGFLWLGNCPPPNSSSSVYWGEGLEIPRCDIACRSGRSAYTFQDVGFHTDDSFVFSVSGWVPLHVYVVNLLPFPDTSFWVCAEPNNDCQAHTTIFGDVLLANFNSRDSIPTSRGGRYPSDGVGYNIKVEAEVDPIPSLFADDGNDPAYEVGIGSWDGGTSAVLASYTSGGQGQGADCPRPT